MNSPKGVVALAQKFDYPKSETDLRQIQDQMYARTKELMEVGQAPSFKSLLEIISSDAVILTAIHKIKANKGSMTAGTDRKTIRNFLELPYEELLTSVKSTLANYKPEKVRRVHIPKPGKTEKRPLGIPSILDRIIQECVRTVIEPILEAQFFKHSYGFRPMRDSHMALERIKDIVYKTGFTWFVEGDISKFFDNVNHTILIKRLWHMGIHDRRVLMIIKSMLKAGVLGENERNELGTPQGGIISPLLANVYLDSLDQMAATKWEEKHTKHSYSANNNRFKALRKSGNLKEAYLIRYADDFVVITNSRENAEKWKWIVGSHLEDKLKLKLSEEKTLITNVRKTAIHFAGFTYKLLKDEGKSKTGYISRVSPIKDRLDSKVREIRKTISKLRFTQRDVAHQFNLINSKIRGLIEYYEPANTVNVYLNRYQKSLEDTLITSLKRRISRSRRGRRFWSYMPANQVNNLISVHSLYTTQIITIQVDGMKIGLTSLGFCRWKMPPLKNQDETPYSATGRELYLKRTLKKPAIARADELLKESLSALLAYQKIRHPRYNFEYFLNRAYAYNRDRGKCRVCREDILPKDVHTHHVRPNLPLDSVNKVAQLATVHSGCHECIHDGKDYSHLNKKTWMKIMDFREKLGETST